MVRTDHFCDFAFVCGTDTRTTVPTGVVKGTNISMTVAYNHDRVIAYLQRDIVTGVFNFKAMACKNPLFMPELFKILTIDLFIKIQLAIERVPGFTLIN